MGLLESLDVYPKKARVSGSKRRVKKTLLEDEELCLLNVKPARMSVKICTYCLAFFTKCTGSRVFFCTVLQLFALVFCFGDQVLSPGSSLATDFLGVVPLWRVAQTEEEEIYTTRCTITTRWFL